MPARPDTVLSALAQALARDPGRPLVTFYDGASGERIELSVKTVDNWVNKVANLFGDELLLEPGDGVRVRLPVHWQSTVTLLGAWTAGLSVISSDSASEAAASVAGPAAISSPEAVEGQAVACSLLPLGGPFTSPLPVGWLDFALTVPGQPDALLAAPTVGPDDVAVIAATGEVSHRALTDLAFETAAGLGLSPGGRLMTDTNPSHPPGMQTALVAPLVSGCSVVLVTNCDDATQSSIAAQERVTATAWAPR